MSDSSRSHGKRGPRSAPSGYWRRTGQFFVWFVAVVLSFVAFGTSVTLYTLHPLHMPIIGALVGVPFAAIATRPFLGWAVSTGAAAVLAVMLPRHPGGPWDFLVVHGLVIFVLLLAVSLRGRWRSVVTAWLGTCVLFGTGSEPGSEIGWVVGVTAIVVVGLLISRIAVTTVELDRQTQVSAEEKARRQVLEERTRIARDLHDIVAHHMSLIVVQAETAAFRRPNLQPEAREELEAISCAAREALSETRALLTVLRREDEPAELAPQPGIEQVEELCRSATRAGASVSYAASVPAGRVRGASSLAAYRIVQESLSNARRHAPGAPVRVSLGEDAGSLVVTVENPRPLTDRVLPPCGPPGHGIIGMREHTVAEGGTLEIGPTPDGGFRVRAVLPGAVRPETRGNGDEGARGG
jgi:signal transduction histidine kinase